MTEKAMNQDLRKSVRLLVIYISILAFLAGASVFLGYSGATFWKCGIYELFGLYCLTCGATRAAAALGRFEITTSILHNPLPFLLACFLFIVILYEAVCVIRKKRTKIQWFPWSVLSILGIEIVFCLLKNLHVIPEI